MYIKAVGSFRRNLFSFLKEWLPATTFYLAINTTTIQTLLLHCILTVKSLLIMNMNPLFWINELKEISKEWKPQGQLWAFSDVLYASTQHITLCLCLDPLCYSLIILEGLKFRELIAQTIFLSRDSPYSDTFPNCAQPPCIIPINPVLDIFAWPSIIF